MFILTIIKHVKLLLRTNTLWLTVAWVAWEIFHACDPGEVQQRLAEHHHLNAGAWGPTIIAVIGLVIKIIQNAQDQKK